VLAAAGITVLSLIGLCGSLIQARQVSRAVIDDPRALFGLIDPNAADAARLTLLPRIGPVLAERIVADRAERGPFASASDLQRVRGIGPKTVERIAPMLTFGAETQTPD